MSILLQISDPHFGTEQAEVVEALVMLARQQQPDLLVLSGDITQRARPAQFRAARAFTDRLRVPVLAVPGNHDLPLFEPWARLRRPYGRYIAAFGDDLEPVHCARPDGGVRQHHAGLAPQAWRDLRASGRSRGAAAGGRRGRPVARGGGAPARGRDTRAEDASNRLRGHAAALRRWAAAGADLVMGGHIHLPYVQALHGLARPMWAVQAGTAVSSRVRAGVPNSVNLLRWQGAVAPQGGCLIEQWDYARGARAFVRTAVSTVHPARA